MGAPMSESPSGTRHVVVGWILAAAAIAYLDRVCISTAAPAIKAELALSDSQMGLVFSAFTLAYALFDIGEAGMFTGAAQAFGRWLPIAERGRAFGLALMTAAFGGALSQPLVV